MFASLKEFRKVWTELGVRAGDRVVAIDHGLDWCRQANVGVDLALGDWDSLVDQKQLAGVRCISLPQDKDYSDFFFSLGAASHLVAEELVVVGVSGGRPDHELAVLLDLAEWVGQTRPPYKSIRMFGRGFEMVFLGGKIRTWSSKLQRGQIFSIFCLGHELRGVTLSGLLYPLKKARLTPGSRGLSNCGIGKTAKVRIASGSAILMISSDT